jgi:hypothetical protein
MTLDGAQALTGRDHVGRTLSRTPALAFFETISGTRPNILAAPDAGYRQCLFTDIETPEAAR